MVNTAFFILSLLVLLACGLTWEFFWNKPKALVACVEFLAKNVRPSIGCIAAAGWLLLAGAIALVVFAATR